MSLRDDMEYVLNEAESDEFEDNLMNWTRPDLIAVIHELVWMYKGLCD